MLKASSSEPFPINASQLRYLLEHKYLDNPIDAVAKIDDDIREKNKCDRLTRLITVIQVSWFVLQLVSRLSQGLSIATFELATLAFVACTLPTFLCWKKKPAGMPSLGLHLVLDSSIDAILHRAGKEHSYQALSGTPLDFADEHLGWTAPLHRSIPRKLGMHRKSGKESIDRIPNDRMVNFTSRWRSWSDLNVQGFRLWVVAYGAIISLRGFLLPHQC